jgi:hypothetical protein
MEHLRGEKPTLLWIDALCINQSNPEERNQEVRRMAEIYSEADEVLIWLGDSHNNSDLAMRFIPKMSSQSADQLIEDGRNGLSWVAFGALMRRPWFTRRWVIQEVAFARHATLCCGNHRVPWIQFCEAIAIFIDKVDEIKQTFHVRQQKISLKSIRASILEYPAKVYPASVGSLEWFGFCLSDFFKALSYSDYDSVEFPIGEVQGGGAPALITALDVIIRKDAKEVERLCTIETLLAYLPAFKASDPRDVVFAITSLAKDTQRFPPNYRQSVAQVCNAVIQGTVEQSGSLNIICRPWAPIVSNAPSWLPQISGLPFAPDLRGIYNRKGADSLVGLPDHRVYLSSGSKKALETIISPFQTRYILAAKGFKLQPIRSLENSASGGTIPSSWGNKLAGSRCMAHYLEDSYWRTMVANRDEKGAIAPPWFRDSCQQLYIRHQFENLDTKLLLLQERMSNSGPTAKFLRRVQAVTWDRRLVRLMDGSLGLVPEDTEPEDSVCILFGCDVPVVLRKQVNDTWKFIGEAYVHGVMDGEAMNRPYGERTFRLA